MRPEPTGAAPALIWCPFPDRETAEKIAHSLLDERLVACANIVPGMVSIFVWDGEKDEAEETGALLKTNSDLLEKAISRLGELHPYDLPAIVGWCCDAAPDGTRSWLGGLSG